MFLIFLTLKFFYFSSIKDAKNTFYNLCKHSLTLNNLLIKKIIIIKLSNKTLSITITLSMKQNHKT